MLPDDIKEELVQGLAEIFQKICLQLFCTDQLREAMPLMRAILI